MKYFDKVVPQRMPYLLPYTQSPSTWRITTATCCLLTSACNKNSPIKLFGKLNTLSLGTTLCNWILVFLTSVTQIVWIGSRIFSALVLNNGEPQGSVLSTLLFTLYTRECTPRHQIYCEVCGEFAQCKSDGLPVIWINVI